MGSFALLDRNVEVPSAPVVPTAGTTIAVNTPSIPLAPTGNVVMTATPTIATSGVVAGTRVIFYGTTAYSVTFQSASLVTGTALRLGGAGTRAVGQYDVLELIFDGTNWCEIAYADNA